MRIMALAAMALLTVAWSGSAADQVTATFIPLGDLPGGDTKSAGRMCSDIWTTNGRVVVGFGTPASPSSQAVRWTINLDKSVTLEPLVDSSEGSSWATACTPDGAVIVGYGRQGIGGRDYEAFRLTADGTNWLGDLPGATFYSVASSCSSNRVFGTVRGTTEDYSAFWWEAPAGPMTKLPPSGMWTRDGAARCTPDGNIVVGRRNYRAATWAYGGSGWVFQRNLDGSLPPGFLAGYSCAVDCSDDGNVVVGYAKYTSDSKRKAVLWSIEGGTVRSVDFGLLNPGDTESYTYACSHDGSLVTGTSGPSTGPWTAFIAWVSGLETGGAITVQKRSLKEWLETDCGLDLTGWTLEIPHDISAGGGMIVGYGKNPEGQQEAFAVVFEHSEPACWMTMRSPAGLAIEPRVWTCEGWDYQLHRSVDLVGWSPFANPLHGDGRLLGVQDTDGLSRAFYRASATKLEANP